MADQQQNGGVRQPAPEEAARDSRDAARQEQVHRDHDALQQQARRVDASVDPEARDKTIGQIVSDAEGGANRD